MWTLRELPGCMSSLGAHVLLNGLPGKHGSLSICDVLVHLAAQVADRIDASHVSLVARPTHTPVLAALGLAFSQLGTVGTGGKGYLVPQIFTAVERNRLLA